jgi:hypothetical protein
MKKLGKFLLTSPVVCAVLLAVNNVALAQTTELQVDTDQDQDQDQEVVQVNSVSQLSDVQPTDWAFQALQSLVERYGCIAGYPNGTYRGNKAMTRYEFAAGLNACLARINELIATHTADAVKKDDLAKIQKLQDQFSVELATLRSRVDALEARDTDLTAHQFATVTKLNAEIVVGASNIFTGNSAPGVNTNLNNTLNKNPIIGDRVRLNFDTSFTGQDLLRVRLQSSNLDYYSANSTPSYEGDFRYDMGNFNNAVIVDAFLYQFPINRQTNIVFEANNAGPDDFMSTVNPYLDGDGGTGALTEFGTRNPIYFLANGTGIGIQNQINQTFQLSLGYLANQNLGNPNPNYSYPANPATGNGLFNGAYSGIAQLTVKPSNKFTFALTYLNSYNIDYTNGNGSAGSNQASVYTFLYNKYGAAVPVSSNTYGLEASYQVSPQLVIGGWAGYTDSRILNNPTTAATGDVNIWNFAVTFALPDLGKKGNLGGLIVGMEPKVTSVSSALQNAGVISADPDTSILVECFYQYKVNDHINITPDLIWITAPNDDSTNSGIVIGAIRTTFTF